MLALIRTACTPSKSVICGQQDRLRTGVSSVVGRNFSKLERCRQSSSLAANLNVVLRGQVRRRALHMWASRQDRYLLACACFGSELRQPPGWSTADKRDHTQLKRFPLDQQWLSRIASKHESSAECRHGGWVKWVDQGCAKLALPFDPAPTKLPFLWSATAFI